jgi:ABC-type antimicrobial peptide transport system permease subunit
MAAGLLGAFGLLGLVLASVGIYGLMSYYVAQRTHEVGIRMALGAEPQDVLRQVVTEGMKVVGIGLAIGLLLALAAGPLVSPFVLGISATDPLTLAGITVLLTLVALAAIFIPGRRATRVEPIVALNHL